MSHVTLGRIPWLVVLTCVHLSALALDDAKQQLKPAVGDTSKNSARFVLNVPQLERPPTLEDFAGMEAGSAMAQKMVRADHFMQNQPKDGQPASQPTEAYLGYDDKNIYVVFVCFDSEPNKIRAHMTRRNGSLSGLVHGGGPKLELQTSYGSIHIIEDAI